MKKLLLLLSLMFVLSITTFSQTTLGVWGGHSWINGIIGVEAQYGHFGIGAGYMPTKMPYYGDKIPSFGGSVTYYTKANEDFKKYKIDYCYYGSIGVASAGYRYQDINFEEGIIPMTYGMVGVKSYIHKISLKAGLGYGFCKDHSSFTFEIGLGYILFTNR